MQGFSLLIFSFTLVELPFDLVCFLILLAALLYIKPTSIFNNFRAWTGHTPKCMSYGFHCKVCTGSRWQCVVLGPQFCHRFHADWSSNKWLKPKCISIMCLSWILLWDWYLSKQLWILLGSWILILKYFFICICFPVFDHEEAIHAVWCKSSRGEIFFCL